jgi:hypothetical protein
MRNIFAMAGLLVSLCGAAQADPCFGGTVASYIAASSCTFFGSTISDFSYQSNASGGASSVDASKVAVNPEIIAGENGLLFSAKWSVGPGEVEDSIIGFTITCVQCKINDLILDLAGSAGSSGIATVMENSSSPALSLTTAGLNLADIVTFPPVSSIALVTKIEVSGGTAANGFAQITTASTLFSSVPEPRFGMLCLGGALLISLFQRKSKLRG